MSERVAAKQGRLHVWVDVCCLPLRVEVRIISPLPLHSKVMDSGPWVYNTYSTVHTQLDTSDKERGYYSDTIIVACSSKIRRSSDTELHNASFSREILT